MSPIDRDEAEGLRAFALRVGAHAGASYPERPLWVERDGRRYKLFYGMSSRTAMERYAGGVARHRASEGKEVLVELRGPVDDTVQEILGGLRSACTYVGARRLKELSKRTTFIRVSQQLNEVFGKH